MARLVSIVCCAVLATAVAASADAAVRPAEPVPSLTPAQTAELWRTIVSRRGRHRFATADCSPARVVFYAPTDWMRLATSLAASPSPCAHYYVSVPPLANDKTSLRAGYASQIRALGPSFHAVAEMSVTGWTEWVASTGNGWYAAGVEARRRMAAAGYDADAGDLWSLNELSTAVRAGTGSARANMRAFLDGLHDGESGPGVRGIVFTAGIAQSTSELSVYQSRLQDWYEDAAFWTDVAGATSDWSQEVYGDVRAYAAPATTREARRDALNEYLQHPTALAAAAPESGAAARTLVAATSTPLANAAWRYDAAFGWTDVESELMQDYVSAQTFALRAAGTGRFGFAWSPRNLHSASDFAAQSEAVLVRLAAAIAGSDEEGAEGACAPTWCTGELAGAALTTGWRSFAAWRPSRLAVTSAPQQLSTGAASAPIAVQLQTSTGVPYTAGLPVPVELSTSSATAELAAAAGGPWSRALTLPIASQTSAASVHVRDATAGTFTLTASAPGKTAATQDVTVTAPASPPAPPPPAPPPAPAPPPGGGGGGGPAPDIELTGEAPASAAVGATVTYTLRARNLGGHANRVLLDVRLPAEAEHLGSEADRGRGCAAAGSALACDLDFLGGELVATVRIHAAVRRTGALGFSASASSDPVDGRPGNEAVTLTTAVAEPQAPVAAAPNVAPRLRTLSAARVSRGAGVATIRLRVSVSEPVTLRARVTRVREHRPLVSKSWTARRAGSYGLAVRLSPARLVRGRAYVVRLTATDAAGASRSLVVRVRG